MPKYVQRRASQPSFAAYAFSHCNPDTRTVFTNAGISKCSASSIIELCRQLYGMQLQCGYNAVRTTGQLHRRLSNLIRCKKNATLRCGAVFPRALLLRSTRPPSEFHGVSEAGAPDTTRRTRGSSTTSGPRKSKAC